MKKNVLFLIIGALVLFALLNSKSPFTLIRTDLDYSIVKGAEFDSNTLNQKYWNLDGCYAATNFYDIPSGCTSRGGNIFVNPTDRSLNMISVGGKHLTNVEYKGDLLGKDYKIRHSLDTPGVCVQYTIVALTDAGNQGTAICTTRDCRQNPITSSTVTEGKGEFSVISSRLNPQEGITLFNGQRMCEFNLSGKHNPTLHIDFEDTRDTQSNGAKVSLNNFVERIPFDCNVNKGAGEVLVSEVIPSGKPFDKYTLSYPPEKFCIDFGAYLYDPNKGFATEPQVYQKLQNGESITTHLEVKLFYIVNNKDPLTGQPYFGSTDCPSGQAIDTKSKTCTPTGGFVDLCRTGLLDTVQGSCMSRVFDKCDGTIVLALDGSKECQTFLPNLNQLCASGTINAKDGTCTAPKIDCGITHNLIQISPSEFKCVPKDSGQTSIAQTPTVSTTKVAFPESITSGFTGQNILIGVGIFLFFVFLWRYYS